MKYISRGRAYNVQFTHSINKKSIFFLYFFIWYQSHGRFELRLCHVLNSDKPLNGCFISTINSVQYFIPTNHCSVEKPLRGTFWATAPFRPASPPLGSLSPDLYAGSNLGDNQCVTRLHAHDFSSVAVTTRRRVIAHGSVSSHHLVPAWLSPPGSPFQPLGFLI